MCTALGGLFTCSLKLMFVCLFVIYLTKLAITQTTEHLILVLRDRKEDTPTNLSFEMDLGSLFLVHGEDEMSD
jgi:hypothetical protein